MNPCEEQKDNNTNGNKATHTRTQIFTLCYTTAAVWSLKFSEAVADRGSAVVFVFHASLCHVQYIRPDLVC